MKNYSFVCFSFNVSRQETERQKGRQQTFLTLYMHAPTTTAIPTSKHNAISCIRENEVKHTLSGIQHCAHLHAPPYLSPESTGQKAGV